MRFHHIGIATSDISIMIQKLESVMKIANVGDIIYDELQDANLCMLTMEDGTNFELISGKVVENIVKKRQYLYHTCYVVQDIEKTIADLVSKGALLISEEKPAVLFNNRRVAFLMWDLGMIELLEGDENGVN